MSYLLREERGESFKLSPLSPPSLPSQDTVMQLIPSGREGEEGLDPLQTLPPPKPRPCNAFCCCTTRHRYQANDSEVDVEFVQNRHQPRRCQ